MSLNKEKLWQQALGLGLITGGRSMTGIAALSDYANKNPRDFNNTPAQFISTDRAALLTKVAAVGEIVVDKLPFVPPRTQPAPLLARIATGATVGAGLYLAAKQPPYIGGALGAVGALVGSYAGYFFRSFGNQKLHIPALLLAVIEDAVVVTAASRILSET